METGASANPRSWLLRFEPRVAGEDVVEVPCNALGQVDLDALHERERDAYFYARALRAHNCYLWRVVRASCP